MTDHNLNAEVYCLAGNLCNPIVFDEIEFPQGIQKRYFDYLRESPTGNVDQIAQDIVNRCKAKNKKNIVLAGYSAGGVIAIAAASKAPELFRGLVLSNTGVCAQGNSKSHFPQDLREHGKDEKFLKSFLASCFAKKISDKMLNELTDYAQSVSLEKAIEVSESLRQLDCSSSVSAFRAPVLILWGKQDRRRTVQSLEQLKDCLPQSEVHLLDAGHTPMYDASKDYEQLSSSFLQRIFQER